MNAKISVLHTLPCSSAAGLPCRNLSQVEKLEDHCLNPIPRAVSAGLFSWPSSRAHVAPGP